MENIKSFSELIKDKNNMKKDQEKVSKLSKYIILNEKKIVYKVFKSHSDGD